MCQRASGAPFAALFYLAAENIAVTKGQTRIYQSSPGVQRHFCADCGSPVFFCRLNRPAQRAIFVGSLDDPNDFQPDMHVCVSSSVNWLERHDTVPRHDEKPEGMTPTLHYDPVTGRAD
jgi:hypothetical protein